MTKEDVIRMAKEADLWMTSEERIAAVQRFAKLVYERTFKDANYAASRTILDAAVAQEREACAKVVEDAAKPLDHRYMLHGRLAEAIRARAVIKPERTLTDEVIADLWHQNGGFHHHFARAIERWLKGEK